MQSDHAGIANLSHNDSAANPQRRRLEFATITQQLQSDCEVISQGLQNDYNAAVQRFRSVSAATAHL
jgi:uncharacterized pyridoxal phosphate-containing UPF0001 family protein